MKNNSQKKTVYVIINPTSGTSSKGNIPIKITEMLDSKDFYIHFIFTGYAGHGYEIAKEAVTKKIDIVIAVGGDGTVNEVGRALIGTETILGIIPLGSGNGLARDLGISRNLTKAIEIIKKQNIKKIDYGVANNHVFFCTCGFGFDAEVAEKSIGKKTRGTLMYFKNMVNAFFQQEPKNYEIICEEGTIKTKAFVVTCANAAQYGYNAYIAPHANIQDGKMNLAILEPLGLTDVPLTSLQLFTKKIDQNKKMQQILTSKATIVREKAGIMHIDGDALLGPETIEVEIINQGLNVFVP